MVRRERRKREGDVHASTRERSPRAEDDGSVWTKGRGESAKQRRELRAELNLYCPIRVKESEIQRS